MKITAIYQNEPKETCKLPLFISPVKAGFPSPADDFVEKKIDLNEHLIKRPSATFFVRVEGNSMRGAGIYSGDLLVVDKSMEPKDKAIIVAIFDGDFTVKRFRKEKERVFLVAEHEDLPPVEVQKGCSFEVWGVVTYVIHKT